MIFYIITFIFKNIFYLYFYFFLFLIFLGLLEIIYIIFLESYYWIIDNLNYIYFKNTIINKNLCRFINNKVIIKKKNNIEINGFLENIYIFNDFFFNNRIYFKLVNKYILNKNQNIYYTYINCNYIRSIEYTYDKKSKKLFNLFKKYSNIYYPNDILKIIEDYT